MKIKLEADSWYAALALFGCALDVIAEITIGVILCVFWPAQETAIVWACIISGILVLIGIILVAISLAEASDRDVEIELGSKPELKPEPDFTKPHSFNDKD